MSPATNGKAMRDKGAWAEREAVRVLRRFTIPADRAYGQGRNDDAGDIDGVPSNLIQVKWRNRGAVMPQAWWRSTTAAAGRHRRLPVLIIGVAGLPAETWIVWSEGGRWRLEDWAALLREAA